MAQAVRRLPAIWETWVQSLGWEHPLEKEMATHSSILAWRIPWTEEPGGLQSVGLQRVGHDWVTSFSSKFQVYSILWLTIVTLLYIRAPECISCISETLYPLTSIFPFPSCPNPLTTVKWHFWDKYGYVNMVLVDIKNSFSVLHDDYVFKTIIWLKMNTQVFAGGMI